jgi:hypothetical protein
MDEREARLRSTAIVQPPEVRELEFDLYVYTCG